jgi:flagellar biosynthesis/type III secretory pathway protein FliH
MAELQGFAKQLGPRAEKTAMTLAERLEQKGIEEGIEEGRKQGHRAALAETLLLQLEVKFGAIDDATRERLLAASDEELKHWSVRVLTAASLDELFA